MVEAPRLGFPQPTPQPFTYTCCFHTVTILMFPPVHALRPNQSLRCHARAEGTHQCAAVMAGLGPPHAASIIPPVHSCSLLFTPVHSCSLLFTPVHALRPIQLVHSAAVHAMQSKGGAREVLASLLIRFSKTSCTPCTSWLSPSCLRVFLHGRSWPAHTRSLKPYARRSVLVLSRRPSPRTSRNSP